MSSDSKERAERIVESALQLLTDDRAVQQVEERIDWILETFEINVEEEITAQWFHGVVSGFVRTVYRSGLGFERRLGRSEALAEAIFVIEQSYRHEQARGYDAALVAFLNDGPDALGQVLGQMAEWHKTDQRERRKQRILDRCISPSDWATKCQVAKLLQKLMVYSLPQQIVQYPPGQLAPHWKELLILYADLNGSVAHLGSLFLSRECSVEPD